MSLRSKLIRLAHANPKLRGDLLPLLQKEAAYPQTEVVIRTTSGNWEGIAQNIASVMIIMGIPKPRRDRIMEVILAGGVPDISPEILRELKRRNVIYKVKGPSKPRSLSPRDAERKLFSLMNRWTKDAYDDWMADNPGGDISDVARDLGANFLWQDGVEELVEKSGLRKSLVAEMAADRLVR